MNLKRIAVISYHTCPLSDEEGAEVGGMNIYILELSKALAKRGHILDIYTRSVSADSPDIAQVADNLRVIHILDGQQLKLPPKKLLKNIPNFTKNIISFIEKEHLNYDLISSHYYLSGLIGLKLTEKYHLRQVITFHTLALMKNLVARGEEEKEDQPRIASEAQLMRQADTVIATSEDDAFYMQTLYQCPPGKIYTLIPGVNLKRFRPMDKIAAKKRIGADPDHKLLLFVGRIVPLKGLDVLLYAMKILVEQNPNLQFCLWIVGGAHHLSKEIERLDNIRKVLGLTTYVKFVGRKAQKELPFYYNASEMVIMPSQYESFGITALEAMACGVPVIITDVTGISDLFDRKHNSLITSASNPIMLSEKIANLLGNKKEHEHLRGEVFNIVQDLDWDLVAKRFVNILNYVD